MDILMSLKFWLLAGGTILFFYVANKVLTKRDEANQRRAKEGHQT